MGIKCPLCGSPMWTVATGKAETHAAIVRRRACQKKRCGHRITFYEMQGEDFIAMKKELTKLRRITSKKRAKQGEEVKKPAARKPKQPKVIRAEDIKLTAYAEKLLNK